MTGPLVSYMDGLWSELLRLGYSPLSARNLLRVAAHMSRWLQARHLSSSDLTADRIDAFLHDRRAAGYVAWRTPKGLRAILGYLRSVGAVPPPDPPRDEPQGRLLNAYESYLLEERGLAAATVDGYLRSVRTFLTNIGFTDLPDLREISPDTISHFILSEARSLSIGYLKLKVTALRSFLRYLHVRGHCRDLADAVPAVAGYRDSGLPKGLEPEEVRRLLEACDRNTPTGRRDLAVLLLLSRLGLRAGEVAALEFDDVRWTHGELLVRGKGSQGILPLPQDVGEALVEYVRSGRPRSTSRKLFLQTCAPYRELNSGTVGSLVRNAGKRAQLPPTGAHRLRHTAATQMLGNGATLSEVAHVLRHRSLLTTTIYAKVDRLALRELARPWPGGGA
jgi:site-specific recombinase XerD